KEVFKHSFKKSVDVSTLSYNEALARNIWSMSPDADALAIPLGQDVLKIHANDIPMLTKAYRENFYDIQIMGPDGGVLASHVDGKELLQFIAAQKDSLVQDHMLRSLISGKGENVAQIANRYDTPMGFITGEQYAVDKENAIFSLWNAQKKQYNKLHANTSRPPDIEYIQPWLKPQNYGMVYDNARFSDIDGFQIDAMAQMRAAQEVYQTSANNASKSVLGNMYERLPEVAESELQGVNRAGAGPGFASYSNAALGVLEQKFEFIGGQVIKRSGELSSKVANTFQQVNYGVLNDPNSSTVLATVLHKVRAAGSHRYVIDSEESGLILKSVRDHRVALSEGVEALPPEIPSYVDEFIPIEDEKVLSWLKTHVSANGERARGKNTLRVAQGYNSQWQDDIVYAPQPNPARFKHHAFVVDENKMVSQGDTTMLYATDATTLEKQIAEARAQGFEVYTPDQTANYFKAKGMYDYSLGLNESQIDTALRAKGTSAPAFPITGTPQEMMQDLMQWHAKEEIGLLKEAVRTKYWREFGIIKQMGKEYDEVSRAQIGIVNKLKPATIENPYDDYLKLAMGEAPKSDYPVWQTLNDFVETVGNKTWNAVSSVWRRGNTMGADEIEEINTIFKDYGVEMPATKAQLEAWTNHPAGMKAVSDLVRTQNAILGTITLRLDPINALNNGISSPILTMTELGSWVRNAYDGNAELAGELTKLVGLKAAGVDDVIRSPTKLLGKAYANYWGKDSAALLAKYKNLGAISDLSTQLKLLVEDATIEGTETAADLAAKKARLIAGAKRLTQAGEKWTGNTMVEEMNRFASANAADMLTAPLVREGLMDEQTAGVYISTFVNRTQANMLAAQRPQMFQGPLGQAIGLFQSYQFNFMQQLMRHVGEGSKKDAAMLLGLQASIYGMNGLPAFQAINQHIIGTASGNTSHTDAYTSDNNIVGKEIGDWLLYGAESNFLLDPDLKINLYSRGDITPRQLTIVPTQFSQIPFVAANARVYNTLKNAMGNLNNGGDVWNTMLSAMEQQGISRPLAGMGRVARGFANDGVSFSASGRGNIISANELYTFANLARLSGAKPFDEAIAQDAAFRYQGYQSVDTARRARLSSAIKSHVAGGGTLTSEQLEDFMERYVKIGGKQEEFSKWYTQQLRATATPQVNKLLNSKHGDYMQNIMGGRLMKVPADVRRELEE
ncbi:MAG: hypothetical protein ACK5LJ_02310, partial [Paracoccus sp. (in: a-proteobacteria)]